MPPLLACLALVATSAAAVAAVSELPTEEVALKALATPSFSLVDLESSDVERLVHRGWHEAVRALIALGHQGSEAESQLVATQVRQAVQAERNRLDDLTRALDRNYGKAVDVTPATQWAQNTTHVFLAVKFAQRWNAPGALEVENETVAITGCCLNFTAFGEHSFIRRRYHLSFEFFRKVAADASTWSLASVGRMSLTLAKAKAANWPRLLAGAAAAPKNLGIWRDMKEKWKTDLERMPPLIDTSGGTVVGEAGSKPKTPASQPAAPSGPAPAAGGREQPLRGPKKGKGSKAKRDEVQEADEDEALDKEVELLSECPKASFVGSPVAELCLAAWGQAVDQPRVRGRRWLVELYSSQGEGDAQAMKMLMPVWKRLADVFPSMVPGGRVGAVDCRSERELCKQLGAGEKLPQIRRFLNGGQGDAWTGSYSASLEELAAFGGGDKQEL